MLITPWHGARDICWNQLVPIEFKSGPSYVKHATMSTWVSLLYKKKSWDSPLEIFQILSLKFSSDLIKNLMSRLLFGGKAIFVQQWEIYSMFYVIWATFIFNTDWLGTVSAYVMWLWLISLFMCTIKWLSSIEIQCNKRFHSKPKAAIGYAEISSLVCHWY